MFSSKPSHFHNAFFAPKKHFEPEIKAEVKAEVKADPVVRPSAVREKARTCKYLPGERLLKKIAKQQKEKKQKIDVDRLSKSMARVIASLNVA